MNVYKNFLQRLRKKEFDEVYLVIADDVSQKLKHYVRLLLNVKFEDGRFYLFYGEVKKIIASFIIYYTSTVDEVIKLADAYTNGIERDELLRLAERTISSHRDNQVEFGKEFLPVETPFEKQIYEEIEKEYDTYTEKLFDLKSVIDKLDKRNIENFTKEQFPISVRKTNEMFDLAHIYLGMMLADNIKQIRTSLEEILLRLVNNLKKIQEESEHTIKSLLHQIYEKNKECTMITRSAANSSALAEVTRAIDVIRSKIEKIQANNNIPITRLETEIAYWKSRIEYFNEISENLRRLKVEQENVVQSEKEYNDLKCNELPGYKMNFWQEMKINLLKRKEELTHMIINESKALITFFAFRGKDRIMYTDNIGMYHLDDFDHKVYTFDNSLGIFHINCEGELIDFPDYEYFYDQNGRYIKREDDEKVYQTAPCTSHYKLDDADLLTKATKDCGHSERDNKCKLEIADPGRLEILPDSEPINIKRTLDTDIVRYLWDRFGSVLPLALHDVEKERPMNPIHFLAHKLIYHKYSSTTDENRLRNKEATKFRADIFQKRKEKAVAASKEWKSKQVKPRKPEEFDDAEPRAVYNAQVAEQMFIMSLNFYNN